MRPEEQRAMKEYHMKIQAKAPKGVMERYNYLTENREAIIQEKRQQRTQSNISNQEWEFRKLIWEQSHKDSQKIEAILKSIL